MQLTSKSVPLTPEGSAFGRGWYACRDRMREHVEAARAEKLAAELREQSALAELREARRQLSVLRAQLGVPERVEAERALRVVR